MSDWQNSARFDDGVCKRHQTQGCPSCLTYLVGDERACAEKAERERDEARVARVALRTRIARLEAALWELVRLKDGPRGPEYEAAKPLAWAEARAALGPEPAKKARRDPNYVCPVCDGGPGNYCACTCPKERP